MRAIGTVLACLAIAGLMWISVRLSDPAAPKLKPPPAQGYQSPASTVAGYIGNMMRHDAEASCRYSEPGYQGLCALAVQAMYLTGSKITGTWTVGHVVTNGNRAIVDVEYEEVCLGSTCLTNADPNAGLPGSGTSFSVAFKQNLTNYNYATDCVRWHGRWYVDIVSGPAPCSPHPCSSPLPSSLPD
jgi:hypothetical protein